MLRPVKSDSYPQLKVSAHLAPKQSNRRLPSRDSNVASATASNDTADDGGVRARAARLARLVEGQEQLRNVFARAQNWLLDRSPADVVAAYWNDQWRSYVLVHGAQLRLMLEHAAELACAPEALGAKVLDRTSPLAKLRGFRDEILKARELLRAPHSDAICPKTDLLFSLVQVGRLTGNEPPPPWLTNLDELRHQLKMQRLDTALSASRAPGEKSSEMVACDQFIAALLGAADTYASVQPLPVDLGLLRNEIAQLMQDPLGEEQLLALPPFVHAISESAGQVPAKTWTAAFVADKEGVHLRCFALLAVDVWCAMPTEHCDPEGDWLVQAAGRIRLLLDWLAAKPRSKIVGLLARVTPSNEALREHRALEELVRGQTAPWTEHVRWALASKSLAVGVFGKPLTEKERLEPLLRARGPVDADKWVLYCSALSKRKRLLIQQLGCQIKLELEECREGGHPSLWELTMNANSDPGCHGYLLGLHFRDFVVRRAQAVMTRHPHLAGTWDLLVPLLCAPWRNHGWSAHKRWFQTSLPQRRLESFLRVLAWMDRQFATAVAVPLRAASLASPVNPA